MTDIKKLIGGKRLVQLAVLGGINVVLLALWFLWVTPLKDESQLELSGIEGQIANLRSSILNVKDEMKFFQENQATYESMKTAGFFTPQDRFVISRQLEEMRRVFRIIGFSYVIGDNESVPNTDAQTSKSRLVNSRIKFSNMNLYIDTDIYAFLNALNGFLPGYARVNDIEIRRTNEFSNETLQKIMDRLPAGLLEATLTVDLLTMVPEADLSTAPPEGRGG